jgi:hypothetical protein
MTDLVDNTGTKYVKVEYDKNGDISAALRQDGDWDVMLNLLDDELESLEEMAAKRGMTLNDLAIKAIELAIQTEKENKDDF